MSQLDKNKNTVLLTTKNTVLLQFSRDHNQSPKDVSEQNLDQNIAPYQNFTGFYKKGVEAFNKLQNS